MDKATERKRPRNSQQPNRMQLSHLLRLSPVAALVVTPEGIVADMNAPAWRLLGYGRKDVVGRRIRDLCTDPGEWESIEQSAVEIRSVADTHLHLRKKDGHQVDCLVATRIINPVEERLCLCFLWDFTFCTEKIQELESARERYHLFASLEKDSLWTSEFDSNGNTVVTYISEPIANIMGYTADEVKKMTLAQIIMPSSARGADESYVRQLRIDGRKGVDPSRTWDLELEVRHKNGHPVWIETRSTFIRDERGKPIGIIGFTRDITERRRYEAQLKALSASLVELQETERRHIARELHDQIGQSLTGVRMLIGMLPDRQPRDFTRSINELQLLLDDMMNRVKDLSLELRPSTLDDLGLLPTLLRHFTAYKTQTKVSVIFKQRGLQKRFHPQIETAVFRIIQESLTNVARHAGASVVEVRIVVTRDKLRIQVSDQGKGFESSKVYASGGASGIVGMHERATLLGGRLSVESVPGVGTRLMAEIPLKTLPGASVAV